MKSTRFGKLGLRLLTLWALLQGANAQPIAGKFYEYYIVAKTGSTFTSFGPAPSINERRQVAFQGATASGNGLWWANGAVTPVNFNPGESFGSSDIIQPAVQLSTSGKLVSEDRITTTSPATTNIRLYAVSGTDSFLYAARGGPFKTGIGGYLYDAVLANPATNNNGDVVFTAIYAANAPIKTLGYLAAGTTTPVEAPIRSGNPKPMIADNGVVVIQVGGSGGQANNQILAYPAGLGTPAIIADTTANWTSLDNDPGISRDGRVIAFQGNINAIGAAAIGTTVGPGIFAAIDEGTGFANAKIIRVTGGKVEDVAADRAAAKGNFDGICDFGEICKPAGELGFDSLGNPITLASYGTDSRVGVVNVDFGAAGVDDDTFVISFIATPSSASRDNPALPGTPLLFSAQQGLWTIRVDVQHELAGTGRVYHPYTPIPVVQIGDKLGGDTVTGLGVYDPIANAAHDESGNIRTMRRGDHRVAFWASTNNGQVIVRGNHLDSDQDGLLDHWETTGIDMDQDGVVDLNLAAYGANPFKRDLFLQVDWVGKPGVDTFKPAGAVFPSDIAGSYSLFEANLRNVEALSGPLYGARIDGSSPIDIPAGVTPHVDAGAAIDSLGLPMSINLGAGPAHGGNYVGMPNDPSTLPIVVYFGQSGLTAPGLAVRDYQSVKDSFFGTADKNARLLSFHYTLFAPFQDFIPNYPGTPYSSTIAAGNSASLEMNVPLSSLPGLARGAYVIVTSGAAAGTSRQISSVATNGVSGNAILNLDGNLNPSPSVGDTVAFLEGSTGSSEVTFSPSPDNNSMPGNDVIVSAGAMGVLEGAPANTCMQANTATHELGHTLGLRHGGTDHTDHRPGPTYISVMSYTWQLKCNPTPGAPNYSQSGDITFDDYAYLKFNFSDVMFQLSNSLGQGRGAGYPSDMQQQNPEQTLLDYIAQNGPLDTVAPSVSITSPGSGAAVATGGSLVVNVTATDNAAISRVSVAFDIDGDGTQQTGEAINATPTGANSYQATFPGVSGSAGLRSISAIAWDTSSNSTKASITVNVGGAAQIAVPNVVGQTQAAATTAITGAGLVLGTVTTQSSSTVASGSVISETPSAGTLVNAGSSVNLVVSTGAAQVSVPNVVGQTQAAATTAITGAGLVLGTVTTQSSSTVASGNVISETPSAGTLVNAGSSVNLVVSTGAAQISVPNVVGQTQAAATTAITGAGLVLGTVTTQSSATVAAGSVISETPSAGTLVNAGSSVNLVVSTGAAQISVPSVVGQTQAAATTAITGAGLVLGTVTTQSSSTVASGNVISETPSAGTLVNAGSSVNLVVSTGAAQVSVPNVVGQTQAAATTAITGAGLVLGTVTTQSSATVAAGSVISETPSAGTLVNAGSSVNLVVSTGAAQVSVPNVVGQTQAAATTAITGAGLVLGTVTTQSSGTVAAGNVISETPSAGTLVNAGSSVNLVVSSGAAQVSVPNVVGQTQAAATTAITGAGLVLGTVTTQSSGTVAAGNVISETPSAGTLVNAGSSVNLVVSSGAAQVSVPNVVGQTQAAATTAITGAGLVLGTVTTQSSSTVASGSVISETPSAGTLVNAGSSVNLVVSTGAAQVSVPNVVGQTQAAATTAITGAGLVLGTVTTQSSGTVAAGNVISETPSAGTLVNAGSSVNLVVSSGAAQVSVPNVVGQTQAAATTAITGAGLVLGTVTTQSSATVAAGNVISENPSAGTLVNAGSSVNLVVSSGAAQVSVPNVVGQTQAAATTAITGAGLVLGTVTTQSSATVAAGSVISETPSAGTLVNAGSSINLVVSTGPVVGPAALSALITSKTGAADSRVWTLTISNVGTGPAANVLIDGFTLTQTSGAPCTPALLTVLPSSVTATLNAGASVVGNVTIDFSSCALLSRYTLTAHVSSNSGAVTAAMSLFNQIR